MRMLGAGLAIGAATSAFAQVGFYGGVSMRDNGAESTGLVLAPQPTGQTLEVPAPVCVTFLPAP